MNLLPFNKSWTSTSLIVYKPSCSRNRICFGGAEQHFFHLCLRHLKCLHIFSSDAKLASSLTRNLLRLGTSYLLCISSAIQFQQSVRTCILLYWRLRGHPFLSPPQLNQIFHTFSQLWHSIQAQMHFHSPSIRNIVQNIVTTLLFQKILVGLVNQYLF